MVELKEAIENAKRYAKDVLGNRMFTDPILEEVELSEDEKTLLITLGWDEPQKGLTSSALRSVISPNREYKVFYVDVGTGKVTKMKLR